MRAALAHASVSGFAGSSSPVRRGSPTATTAQQPVLRPSLTRLSRADGSLIYTLLGQKAEGAFARSWGISYGLNLATEWRGIIVQAAKGAFVLAVLERLCLTRPQPWLEDSIDYFSLQALLFRATDAGLVAKIRTMYRHTKRIIE